MSHSKNLSVLPLNRGPIQVLRNALGWGATFQDYLHYEEVGGCPISRKKPLRNI